MLIGIQKVKNLKLAKGFKEILHPGEPEYKNYIKNSKIGIPISKDVQLDLKKLAEKLNIKSIFNLIKLSCIFASNFSKYSS